MSTFKIEVVEIDGITEHPNADRLDLISIRGWNAVAQKGLHQAGDKVVYLPEDSILPENVLEETGLTGKLAGKEKNRVKAIRLRGSLSQGVILPLASLDTLIPQYDAVSNRAQVGDDLTELLGITKYEEPIPHEMSGVAIPRPSWLPKYTDIENIKNYPDTLTPGEIVVVTEKQHGYNAIYAASADDPTEIFVSSRKLCLAENSNNVYWKVLESVPIRSALRELLHSTGAENAAIYGEVIGGQDLKYGYTREQMGFRWFDVMLDGEYQNVGGLAEEVLGEAGLVPVPLLYSGPFDEGVLLHTAGDTIENSGHIREGIVIRPAKERYDPSLGRVILKSINPDYSVRRGGTEFS